MLYISSEKKTLCTIDLSDKHNNLTNDPKRGTRELQYKNQVYSIPLTLPVMKL